MTVAATTTTTQREMTTTDRERRLVTYPLDGAIMTRAELTLEWGPVRNPSGLLVPTRPTVPLDWILETTSTSEKIYSGERQYRHPRAASWVQKPRRIGSGADASQRKARAPCPIISIGPWRPRAASS
jgi:hypothetical protein